MRETKKTLNADETGSWLVRTRTSSYLLNLDTMLGTRNPVSDDGLWKAADLREDGQPWTILEIAYCEVGKPLVLLAAGIADDPSTVTLRKSTPVTSIESLN